MAGLELPGLVFGAVGAAEVCLKMFKQLREKYVAYRSREQDIEVSMLSLDYHSQILEQSIEIVRDDAANMPPEMQTVFEKLFHIIQVGLQTTTRQLERVVDLDKSQSVTSRSSFSMRPRSAAHWVLNLRQSIQESLSKIAEWHQMILFGLMTLSLSRGQLKLDTYKPTADDSSTKFLQSLRAIGKDNASAAITADLDKLSEQQGSVILTQWNCRTSYSSAVFRKTTREEYVIRDRVRIPTGVSADSVWSATRQLTTRLLAISSEDSGILNCVDLHSSDQSDRSSKPRISLLFSLPYGIIPTSSGSLRAALTDRNKDVVSLNDRLELARQLATSIVYLHAASFVHKNIRPETILLLRRTKTAGEMGRAYLVGFEQLRAAEAQSLKIGDDAWFKDIYRHPTRQGLQPEERYSMHHDIYSLGVCMLEIGLWESFIIWQEFDKSASTGPGLRAAQQISEGLKKRAVDNILQEFDNMLSSNMRTSVFSLGKELKEILEVLAHEILPSRMGCKYASIVKACLRCLDSDNEAFGDPNEFQHDDGTTIGTRYLEEVILQLREITL